MPVPGGTTRKFSNARRAPAQELIALLIALIFHFDIALETVQDPAKLIDHDGMIDHQIDRHLRIDLLSAGAQIFSRVAHGCEIHHSGHASKVLHQAPARDGKRSHGSPCPPFSSQALEGGNVVFGDASRHPHCAAYSRAGLSRRLGVSRHVAETIFGCGIEGVVSIILTIYGQGLAGLETIEGRHGRSDLSFMREDKHIRTPSCGLLVSYMGCG